MQPSKDRPLEIRSPASSAHYYTVVPIGRAREEIRTTCERLAPKLAIAADAVPLHWVKLGSSARAAAGVVSGAALGVSVYTLFSTVGCGPGRCARSLSLLYACPFHAAALLARTE
jgi:hypothetical protein